MWGSVDFQLWGKINPGFFGDAGDVWAPAVRDRAQVRPLINRVRRNGLAAQLREGFCYGVSTADLFDEGFEHWRMISNILNIVKGPI